MSTSIEIADVAALLCQQCVEIISVLDEKGPFATRNAGSVGASALGMSRAIVYNLMKEVRS